jgi:O-antigen ligase
VTEQTRHTGTRVPGSADRASALWAPLFLAGMALITTYAGLTDSLPKVFGLLVGVGLLVYAVEWAPEWIVAILLVGQFILHWISSLGGGVITRDDPLGGPLLPMYVLCASLVAARIMLVRRKRVLPPWPLAAQIIMISAVLLGVMIAAGLLYSPAPQAARAKTLGYLAFNLAPAALVVLLVDSEKRLEGLVRAVIVVGLVMAVFTHLGHGVVESDSGAGLYNIGVGKYGISIGGARFAGGTWFARRVDLVIISLLVSVVLFRGILAFGLMIGGVPYLAYLLYLSGARGATAAGAVAFMLVLTLLTVVAKSRRALRSMMVVLLLLVTVVAAGSLRDVLKTPEIASRYEILLRPFSEAGAGADRLEYWRVAWEIFEDYPLFGIGSGGWGMVWNKQDYRDFPHNIFLEVLCEQGVVGFVLLALFFFGTLRLVWWVARHPCSTPRGRNLAIWAMGILTFAGIDAQLSGDIQTNDYLWMAAAIVCVLARTVATAAQDRRPATIVVAA